MKTRLFYALLTCAFSWVGAVGAPRDAQWQQVEEATRQGLPKTAIEHLEPIIEGARADNAYAELVKALGKKIALEGTIQGNKPEEKIVRMQAEIEKAPAEVKPVMEAILAHWYWQYFQQNRWRFHQRTQTAAAPGPDLQTWDLARILAEIDQHFTAALAGEKHLKETPVSTYDGLLERGTVPDQYRPTLFDFLAYEALQFYQAGEQAAVVAEDEFEIDADSPIFGDVKKFITWRPDTADTASPKLKAIQLYQTLLRFHAGDTDRSAFHDADLARIAYGQNVATGESKDERTKAALQRLIGATTKHEVSARALAALATQLNSEGDLVKAREVAQRGISAFPETAGGSLCYNLVQEIEAKVSSLRTEFVWNGPWPVINVTYRNVNKVFFRAVAVDFHNYLAQCQWGFGHIDQNQRAAALLAKPTLEWSTDLPATPDYKERTEKLTPPSGFKPGFYFIFASTTPSFEISKEDASGAVVWVSRLALVTQVHQEGKTHGGFVLDAITGAPIAGATLRVWEHNQDGHYKPGEGTTSNEHGRFQFSGHESSLLLVVEHEGQMVSTENPLPLYGRDSSGDADTRTVFFTDRALYRPGQTIAYKGVTFRYHQDGGKYLTLAGRKLTVVFKDPNGQEIGRETPTTNDYGSFSGVFTAPRDRLMGRMSIEVLEREGRTSFNVEEYKRPKFQVELAAPVEAAKLGAPVTLTGKATAYTGAAIGGAKVKWRVERGVQLPLWCWWFRAPSSKAIAHDSGLTEADGTFKIELPATPDRTVPEKNEPVFTYTIHAEVTDTTGETRTDVQVVRAGYTALRATLGADDWQTPEKPAEFAILTESLDGVPQAASGTLTVHALKQPSTVARAELQAERFWWFGDSEPAPDPSKPESWEGDEVVATQPFTSGADGKATVSVPLKAGIYRASLEMKDRFGKRVTARQTVQVLDPTAPRTGIKLPNLLAAPQWSVEPGETFTALWGTGYDSGRAFVELECNGKLLQSYWTGSDRTQETIQQKVTESMRGGLTLRITYLRENRAYLSERIVDVPWSNKELSITWESFRSKLEPGQKETWTAVITGPDAQQASAEMVATLYDASLDQYQPHRWLQGFGVFRREWNHTRTKHQNSLRSFQWNRSGDFPHAVVDWRYRSFPNDVLSDFWGYRYQSRSLVAADSFGGDGTVELSAFSVDTPRQGMAKAAMASAPAMLEMAEPEPPPGAAETGAPEPQPDLTKVVARKNLNETAFFFPHLTTDDKGVVRMEFTMPEALTEWKFMGFAHDAELRAGLLTGKAVTSKDLMVEPNPPRFVREGDVLEFTVKVSNQSDVPQSGRVRVSFADAASLQPADSALGNLAPEQSFDVPAKQSRSYSWRIVVPDGQGFLTYKAVAATAKTSDGEEGFLPVLSRRILVTESLPLPIRGKTTKQFDFKKLLESGTSDTLRHQSLTVQMTSQPAWYAVMALPYLMEYPYECSEQLFNRLYANTLARHLAGSDPKIRRIFDLWKNTPQTLESPLEKNQDIKAVMLEETPWLRQAKAESHGRRNVGLLFDDNRLNEETARALRTLSERQLSEGLWSWFPGGRPSEYISLYIVTGFGRLRALGTEVSVEPALKALQSLDASLDRDYRLIMRNKDPEKYVPDSYDALYLYGRSFFLKDRPIAKQHQEAVDFLLGQARKHWLNVDNRQSQAHLALALQRFGDKETAQGIVKSIKERSVSDEELGMYWRDLELSWWWYHAPIETQALMIEAFAEVTNDTQAVEDCKVWLLKQKQTQNWKSTKATADAVYGLLLRGSNLLSSDALVEVSLAGQQIKPENGEAGTGFYEKKFSGNEITAPMGQVTVKKTDEGVSWGSVHWQYLEDIAKVTPHEGTPLKLKKTLWVKDTTSKGQTLKPVTGPVSVGDELVVRVELRTDRDMEFVHLKDQRGSGTEPVNVLSRYKYQDGLGFYESTRDTASHFFIDYLPKGVYVFEYSLRVQLKGRYQSGIAEIQCMYAPEFNSHSESVALECK